jgi:hypothetical protein
MSHFKLFHIKCDIGLLDYIAIIHFSRNAVPVPKPCQVTFIENRSSARSYFSEHYTPEQDPSRSIEK